MRLLLLSDTHGHLAQIDDRAARARADAVLHAGDFGFYSDESFDRLEARELFLRVVHSDLPEDEKAKAKKLRSDKLRAFMREKLPLSDLGAWLREGRGFKVPVYAVWGNHEDRAVVEALVGGRLEVSNLHLLYDAAGHRIGPFQIFGLGGNIIPERLLDTPSPLAGEGGKIWTTLAQIGRLAAILDAPRPPGSVRVLVSHLSPGREPLLTQIAARLGADVTVSGHMGSPWTVVWDEFAVRDPGESNRRLEAARARLEEALTAPLPEDPSLGADVARGQALLASLPEPVVDERGVRMPKWYRGAFHVNLPDAPDGEAILIVEDGRLILETRSHGLRVGEQ
jgi:predicted phosphodiesterase